MTSYENLSQIELEILTAIRPFIGQVITPELCEQLINTILCVGRLHPSGQPKAKVCFADAALAAETHVSAPAHMPENQARLITDLIPTYEWACETWGRPWTANEWPHLVEFAGRLNGVMRPLQPSAREAT